MPALFEEFPPVATEDWERAIRQDLKGADYDKRLVWHTDTGIDVRPYYRREHLADLKYLLDQIPGEFPYARGTRASNGWGIREEIDAVDCREANAAAKAALQAGADQICFLRAVPRNAGELRALVAGLDNAPVFFWADAAGDAVAQLLPECSPMRGGMRLHPFTDAGVAAAILKQFDWPEFRPVAIRRASFLESGATSVQQLGFMLAAGIEYMRWMIERGVGVDAAAKGVMFAFSVGSSYFFQIARFRAFRMLWARALEGFGASPEASKAYLFARTADWTQSIYDSYNNVLRGTTQAMSAALGGVDSLAVAPFDETYRNADDASLRLARNTQVILKKEAFLDRVADPGAGSYYIEVLTDSLAQASWKLMQEVESIGGYLKARDSGMIPAAVQSAREKKEKDLAFGRRVIVGSNKYPNVKERMLDRIGPKDIELVYGRLAEPFEDIRLRTERHAAAGNKTPVFLLAEVGDLKMRKARSGFVFNFLGCGGFDLRTGHFENPEAIADAVSREGADVVVLCSSDEEYSKLAPAVVTAVKPTPVLVAGNPKDAAELERAGVAGFIHVRSNAMETLTQWQERLGVRG